MAAVVKSDLFKFVMINGLHGYLFTTMHSMLLIQIFATSHNT